MIYSLRSVYHGYIISSIVISCFISSCLQVLLMLNRTSLLVLGILNDTYVYKYLEQGIAVHIRLYLIRETKL